MKENNVEISCIKKRELKNSLWLFISGIIWLVALAVAVFGIKNEWFASGYPTYIAIAVQALAGFGMFWAFRRLITEMDEMQRKIQLDALALSLGITIFATITYDVLEKASIVSEINTSNIIFLISFTYIAGVIVGNLRYR